MGSVVQDIGHALGNTPIGTVANAAYGAVGGKGDLYTGSLTPYIDKLTGRPIPGASAPAPAGLPGGLQLPTTAEQVNQQYQQVQNAQAQQAQFMQALQAQNGLANQNTAFQNAQNMANGTGPNPAQAQLAQATGANVANQAALMAGQRGAGANAGLMARQAANQGANIQQNAAGQAATLQAQQQLAGQQQMANIAGQQAGQLQGAYGQNNQLTLGAQQNILGGIGGQNNVISGMTNAGTAADAARYAADKKQNGDMFGGLMGGLGAVGQLFGSGGATTAGGTATAGGAADSMGSLLAVAAKGGMINANSSTTSPIGNHGPRSQSAQFLSQAKQLKTGGAVPGHAAAPGNSYKNDTVKAMLSPGEVVIPRSVMQSKDPAEAAKAFVAAVLAKQGSRK